VPARRRKLFSHRNLLAVEAVLVVALLKSWIEQAIRDSTLADPGKVLFVMASTVGLLGALYYGVEALTTRSVEGAHAAMRLFFPRLAVHAVVLFVLYLLYAARLGLAPF
jgi:hypothetical protein